MAITRVVMTALYVGQGMGHLVELYEKKHLKFLMLFDFGSDNVNRKSKKLSIKTKEGKSVGKGLEYVRTKAGKREPGKQYIDYIFISHSDFDHWSLISEIENYITDKTKAYIGSKMVDNKINEAFNCEKIQLYENCSPNSVPVIQCDADANVLVRLLYVNRYFYEYSSNPSIGQRSDSIDEYGNDVTSIGETKPGRSKAVNALSAIFQLEVYNNSNKLSYSFLFNGDIDSYTMRGFNNFFSINTNQPFLKYPYYFISIPHHGSLETNTDNHKQLDVGNFSGFINLIEPKYSIASVGKNNHHKHPNTKIINALREYYKKYNSSVDSHNITFHL